MELQDQRVLVTGATAGIGQEAAKLFARRGASVVITGRDTQRGAQTVAAIEAEGGRAEFIAADLNDIKSVRRLAEQAGDVDVVINNAAATRTPFAPTLEQNVESFDTIFDVNVRAPFFLTAALLPKMIARGSGAIVNISTMYASVSRARWAGRSAPNGPAAPAPNQLSTVSRSRLLSLFCVYSRRRCHTPNVPALFKNTVRQELSWSRSWQGDDHFRCPRPRTGR